MLHKPLRAYVLIGGIEPSIDALDAPSLAMLARAELVVAITPFASEELTRVAHLMLPMGTFAETAGTYVNCEGVWQSQSGAALPVGEARPGWKILRVLGNLLNLEGFDYQSSEEVLKDVRQACAALAPAPYQGTHPVGALTRTGEGARAGDAATGTALIDVPMYQVDALVRRSPSLQKTREGRTPLVRY
jgi:NADH-quinone oxidoreductase subunit G